MTAHAHQWHFDAWRQWYACLWCEACFTREAYLSLGIVWPEKSWVDLSQAAVTACYERAQDHRLNGAP